MGYFFLPSIAWYCPRPFKFAHAARRHLQQSNRFAVENKIPLFVPSNCGANTKLLKIHAQTTIHDSFLFVVVVVAVSFSSWRAPSLLLQSHPWSLRSRVSCTATPCFSLHRTENAHQTTRLYCVVSLVTLATSRSVSLPVWTSLLLVLKTSAHFHLFLHLLSFLLYCLVPPNRRIISKMFPDRKAALIFDRTCIGIWDDIFSP